MVRVTVCYVALLGVVTLLADAGWLTDPLERLHEIPSGDKALHFALVGLLALMVNLSLVGRLASACPLTVMWASLSIAGVATCEELSNLVVDGRNWSLGDLAANYLGILCLGVLPVVLSRHFAARRSRPGWTTPGST